MNVLKNMRLLLSLFLFWKNMTNWESNVNVIFFVINFDSFIFGLIKKINECKGPYSFRSRVPRGYCNHWHNLVDAQQFAQVDIVDGAREFGVSFQWLDLASIQFVHERSQYGRLCVHDIETRSIVSRIQGACSSSGRLSHSQDIGVAADLERLIASRSRVGSGNFAWSARRGPSASLANFKRHGSHSKNLGSFWSCDEHSSWHFAHARESSYFHYAGWWYVVPPRPRPRSRQPNCRNEISKSRRDPNSNCNRVVSKLSANCGPRGCRVACPHLDLGFPRRRPRCILECSVYVWRRCLHFIQPLSELDWNWDINFEAVGPRVLHWNQLE